MAVTVIPTSSKRTHSGRADVCLQVDSYDEMHGVAVKRAAVEHARVLGLNGPAIYDGPKRFKDAAGIIGYWVDPQGNVLTGDAFKTAPTRICRCVYEVQEAAS